MKGKWTLTKTYSPAVLDAFSSLEKVFSLAEGEIVSQDSICSVTKIKIDNRWFYIKRYKEAGKGLRKYIGRSRCRAEWENLEICQQLKINTPKVVAYGEESWLFNFNEPRRAVLITEAVENAVDLEKMMDDHPEFFAHPAWRKKVSNILADYIGRLHKYDFIHRDFKARNILISKDVDNPKVYFFDMPAGDQVSSLKLTHGLKKDLFLLDRSIGKKISRSEKLRFYLVYKVIPRLTKAEKRFIRGIYRFYKRKS